MLKSAAILAFVCASFATAAQKHSLRLFQDSLVAGTELESGEYKLTYENGRAVISNGRKSAEAAVKVETAESKFGSTSVRYQNGDGKYRVREIRIGGTNTKLVFDN